MMIKYIRTYGDLTEILWIELLFVLIYILINKKEIEEMNYPFESKRMPKYIESVRRNKDW